jgi:hypothetical protein
MLKALMLSAVIGMLVGGSALFVSSHPRAMTACSVNCE